MCFAGNSIGSSTPCESRREVQILRKGFLAGLSLLVYGSAEGTNRRAELVGAMFVLCLNRGPGEGGVSQQALL
jgi:hypothetical protein